GLLLLVLDPNLVRKIIGGIIIAASLLIMSGWQYRGKRGVTAATLFGGASGLVNGFAGVGGPIFVIYILAHPDETRVQRANIVLAAGLQILLIAITLTATGAVSWDIFLLGTILAPLQILSGMIGVRIFALAPQEMYKKFTLIAIVILGASVVIF
ncbi:MAG: TSUP family transporter, partial [Rhodospirillaceae bacterium]|nr:TSUP family transporter [Rhodospirillaceae bacterium]